MTKAKKTTRNDVMEGLLKVEKLFDLIDGEQCELLYDANEKMQKAVMAANFDAVDVPQMTAILDHMVDLPESEMADTLSHGVMFFSRFFNDGEEAFSAKMDKIVWISDLRKKVLA